ncbi:MAG: hypothetical protein M0033_04485 [Nitrospiraceae bacterium]|nr:hypothetical protein [Nitrospiraceae bacterium]
MPSLDDVYRKYGETSEAAQLLETELGNILLNVGAVAENLVEKPDEKTAIALYTRINRQTLGQLLKDLKSSMESVDHLEELLANALKARNHLIHSFYRQYNFRRNSEDGREKMLQDLEHIHHDLLEAYKAVMRLSGIDLDKIVIDQLPTGQVPI